MRYELKQCKLKGALHDTTYETKRRDNSVSLQHTYGRQYNNIIIMNLPCGVHNKITAVHLKNKIMSRVYVTEIVGRLTRYLIYYFIYTTHTHRRHYISLLHRYNTILYTILYYTILRVLYVRYSPDDSVSAEIRKCIYSNTLASQKSNSIFLHRLQRRYYIMPCRLDNCILS